MVSEKLRLKKKRLSDEIMDLRKQISDIDRDIDKSPDTTILYKERYSINLQINRLRDEIKIIDKKMYDITGYDGCIKAK